MQVVKINDVRFRAIKRACGKINDCADCLFSDKYGDCIMKDSEGKEPYRWEEREETRND